MSRESNNNQVDMILSNLNNRSHKHKHDNDKNGNVDKENLNPNPTKSTTPVTSKKNNRELETVRMTSLLDVTHKYANNNNNGNSSNMIESGCNINNDDDNHYHQSQRIERTIKKSKNKETLLPSSLSASTLRLKSTTSNIHSRSRQESLLDQDDSSSSSSSSSPSPSESEEISKLSPSSMEVSFSDPHRVAFNSYNKKQQKQQQQHENNIIEINESQRTNNRRNNNNESCTAIFTPTATIDEDDEEKRRDEFVRSGTHFRSLLDSAFRKVAIGFSKRGAIEEKGDDTDNEDDEDDINCEKRQSRSARKRQFSEQDENNSFVRADSRRKLHGKFGEKEDKDEQIIDDSGLSRKLTAQLAREKMTEVLSLKRAFKEAEEHANAMSYANATLRESSASSTARINTLTESLKITSTKVANARADADSAKAKVSCLGTQLKSLKCALDETKRTCESIRSEHDDIQSSARGLEAKLVQTESELHRVEKEKQEMKQERDSFRYDLNDLNQTTKKIRLSLEKKEDELSKLKKNIIERDDIERARMERTNRLEQELRGARSMLVDATSSTAEAESTTAELESTVHQLQRENKSVHGKIEEIMDTYMRERTKLQEALTEVEREAQKLRMKVTTDEEELQKLKLDKLSNDKEVTQLKNRIASLEKRLKEATTSGVVSPNDDNDLSRTLPPLSSIKGSAMDTSMSSYKTPVRKEVRSNENDRRKSIPGMESSISKFSVKSSGSKFSTMSSGSKFSSMKCSICYKSAYGIMKSCQCGDSCCDMRAHASCIAANKSLPSVSHPGTPAPKLPFILCKGKLSSI